MLRLRPTCALLLATMMSLAVVAPSAAWAEQKLSVSPTKQTVLMDAGETRTVNVTIGAPEDAISASFFHQDFGFGPDYSPVLIPDTAEETTAFSTRGWFTVTKPIFRVPSGGSLTVPVTIEVPDNQPAGTYMGTATFAVDPGGAPRGGEVQTRTGVASVIFVGVEGGAPPKPKVRRFDVARLMSGGRLEPQLVLRNEGSLPFSITGTVRVDGRDATVDGTLPDQVIIPGRDRTLHTGSDNAGRIRIETKGLGIGRHEVEARLRVDPLNDTIVVRRTFWLVPTWLRVLVGVGALGIILLVSWLVVRLRRRSAGRHDVAPVAVATSTEAISVPFEAVTVDGDVEVIDDEDVDLLDEDSLDDDYEDSSDDGDAWSEDEPVR